HPIKDLRQFPKLLIRHCFDPSQWMVARNTGLYRKQCQHTCLSVLCPAHQHLRRYIRRRHINIPGDFQSEKHFPDQEFFSNLLGLPMELRLKNGRVKVEGFMIYSFLQLRLIVLLVALLVLGAMNLIPCGAQGAESKPAWQEEWEKTLEAARKEGQVTVYISGYEEILPEFQKEYPEIKVVPTTGRGSQIGQKLLAERRAEKYLADVVNAGGVTTYQQLFSAKVFDPIKPALLLPEITDVSKWYQGKHHYSDPENLYIFDYVATATYGAISYNTKLVNAKDFKSYWDLLAPKWKGKIISRDIRVSGPGSGNARLFY